jgi:hypothetical protein
VLIIDHSFPRKHPNAQLPTEARPYREQARQLVALGERTHRWYLELFAKPAAIKLAFG